VIVLLQKCYGAKQFKLFDEWRSRNNWKHGFLVPVPFCPKPFLSIPSFNVISGSRVLGSNIEILRAAVLDYFAQEHENTFIAYSASLGHVMGYHDEGETPGQTQHQILDCPG
jgi:hypothetical protein